MWIISRGTKCACAHVRKYDNDILVFQKTLLAVRSLIVQRRIESLVLRRHDATRRRAATWCVHVRAHMRVYSCIVLISRCQQRLAVGLDWYTADTPVTLRYERYGLAKTVPINYTRELGACACSHVRVCAFIYRQIKRGHTMCYWKYAYIGIYVAQSKVTRARMRACVSSIDDLREMKNITDMFMFVHEHKRRC